MHQYLTQWLPYNSIHTPPQYIGVFQTSTRSAFWARAPGPPLFLFFVSSPPPTYFETPGRPHTEISNPNRPERENSFIIYQWSIKVCRYIVYELWFHIKINIFKRAMKPPLDKFSTFLMSFPHQPQKNRIEKVAVGLWISEWRVL